MDARMSGPSGGYPTRSQIQNQNQSNGSVSGSEGNVNNNWPSSSTTSTSSQQQLPSLPSMLYSPSIHQSQSQPTSTSRRGSGASGGSSSSPYMANLSHPNHQLSHPHQQLPSFPTIYQSHSNLIPSLQLHSSNLNQQQQSYQSTSSTSNPSGNQDSIANQTTNSTTKSKGKRKATTDKIKTEEGTEEDLDHSHDQTDEDGKSSSKRITRIPKACSQCRLRKRRCDGAQPICSVCSVLNEPCSYDGNDKKRGPKKGPRQNPKEAARIKFSGGIEKSIASLISKCGQETAREEISRILSENGFDLNELVGQGEAQEGSSRKRVKISNPGVEPHSAVSSLTNTPNSLRGGKELEDHDHSVPTNAEGEEEDELDPDFLATNDRGDLMHRGSSSGIGLIHRRPNHHSPLQKHQPIMQSSNLRTSSNNASQQDSHSGGSPSSSGGAGTPRIAANRIFSHGNHSGSASNSGPIPIPMAHPPPRHGSSTPRSSPSRTSSPARDLNNTSSGQLSEGALAHRDHILNSLSSGPGERSRHSSPALRGRALTPTTSKATNSEMDHSRVLSSSSSSSIAAPGGAEVPVTDSSAAAGPQSNEAVVIDFEPDPVLSSEEHARLFRYYYQGVHPFWPLLYKPALEAIPMEDLRTRLAPVLLYSIYAIASCVVPGEKRAQEAEALKAGETKPSMEGAVEMDWENTDGERYFRCAERYLYDGRLRPDVSAIQACFLLSLYSHGSGELSRAYVFCGLACSMAMDLGLHRFPIHKTSLLYDSVERETRVRLIWHVYILNVMLAAEMGRPVMFRARDCDAPLLNEKEDDEFEKWSDMEEMYGPGSFAKGKSPQNSSISNGEGEKESTGHRLVHAPSCLNWGVRLFIIVERILSEVHSFRRKATLRKQGNAPRILAEIDAELDQWRETLPPHLWLQMPDEEDTSKPSQAKKPSTAAFEGEPVPSFFALDLWLWTATLLLHRPFIPQDPGLSVNDILSNDSHQKSTKAANAICDRLMDFSASGAPVDRLSTDLGYCLFTASVMFWFNSTLPHEEISRDAKQRFALCKEWLRKLSGTWPAASAHRQLLDGFAAIGEEEVGGGGGEIDAHGSTEDGTRKASLDQDLKRRKSNGAVAAWQQQQANQQQQNNQTSVGNQQGNGYQGSVDVPMNSNQSFAYLNQPRNSFSNSLGSRETQEQKQQLIDYYASNSLHRGNGFPGSTSSQFDGNGQGNFGAGSQMGGQMMNTGWGFDAPASIFDIEHLYWNETASTLPNPNVYGQVSSYQPQEGDDLAAPQGFYSGRRRSFQPAQSTPNNSLNFSSNPNPVFSTTSNPASENTNGFPSASPSNSNSSGHSYSQNPAAEGLMSLASSASGHSRANSSMGPPLTLPNNNLSNLNSADQNFNQTSRPNFQSPQSQSPSLNQNSNRNGSNSRSFLGPNANNQNQNQDSSANISPFSFQVDNGGWDGIMSILQLPPSFNS